MIQDLKIGNTYSISIVKYSMLHTYDVMFTKLVRVCLAVISSTAFNHRLNKLRENITQCFIFSVAVCICSCSSNLLSFIDTFA